MGLLLTVFFLVSTLSQNICIKRASVRVGVDATVYVWFLGQIYQIKCRTNTVASTLTVTDGKWCPVAEWLVNQAGGRGITEWIGYPPFCQLRLGERDC